MHSISSFKTQNNFLSLNPAPSLRSIDANPSQTDNFSYQTTTPSFGAGSNKSKSIKTNSNSHSSSKSEPIGPTRHHNIETPKHLTDTRAQILKARALAEAGRLTEKEKEAMAYGVIPEAAKKL
jgi:hypothetical protein